jgi:hypothetical protein
MPRYLSSIPSRREKNITNSPSPRAGHCDSKYPLRIISFSQDYAPHGISLVISLLTLYVTPLIFIENKDISVIPAGIKYLFANIRKSLPLIILTLAMFALNGSINYVLSLYSERNLSAVLLAGYIDGPFCNYLNLLVFITAGRVLMNDSSQVIMAFENE